MLTFYAKCRLHFKKQMLLQLVDNESPMFAAGKARTNYFATASVFTILHQQASSNAELPFEIGSKWT